MRWDTVRSRLLCKVTQQNDRGIRGQREWNDATFPWHTFDGKTLCTLHIHSGSMRIYADFPLLITRGYDYVMCYASTRHTVRGARFLIGCRLNHFKLIIWLFSIVLDLELAIPGPYQYHSISIVDDTSQVKQIGHGDFRSFEWGQWPIETPNLGWVFAPEGYGGHQTLDPIFGRWAIVAKQLGGCWNWLDQKLLYHDNINFIPRNLQL